MPGIKNPVRTTICFAILLGLTLAGCAAPGKVRTEAYDLQVRLNPEQNAIDATAKVHCRQSMRGKPGGKRNITVDFALHPDLEITDVTCSAGRIRRVRTVESEDGEEAGRFTTHRVSLANVPETFDLTFAYAGQLKENVSAGEKRGEIHNFGVSAHVGTDGVHLAGGYWIPAVRADETLPRFTVHVEPVPGYTFVSSASRKPNPDLSDDASYFVSDYPQTDVAVIGGRVKSWSREQDGIQFTILLREDNADDATLERRADVFLTAAMAYMRRYQPLVGPYPYKDFTIVENFFSSGFAYPTFTLLGPAVIAMEDRALRHGYLDHEMLHSWWGNGAYVDPKGGNWCEALTSYGANLHGYVLDNDDVGARKARRDVCNILTRIAPQNDKPLDTFGEENGAGRAIGYQKGSLVFHMLAQKIGVDNFWSAMRTLTNEYTGKYAGWSDLRRVCESASGIDLQLFFEDWVSGTGAPRFTLAEAPKDLDPDSTTIDVVQDGEPFDVELPLRIHDVHGNSRDIVVPVSSPRTTVTLGDIALPAEIELDPDYHVVRRLSGDEILPTIAGSLRGNCGVVVCPEDLWDGYKLFISDVEKKRKKDSTMRRPSPDASQLNGCTLVLVGEAVRLPIIQALLKRSECPIEWTADGFTIDGKTFNSPTHAVLCNVRHPDSPGATITIYYGNSPESLSNAGILWFYGNSLLVYDSPAGGHGHGHAKVVLRRDFERTHRLRIAGNMPEAMPIPQS